MDAGRNGLKTSGLALAGSLQRKSVFFLDIHEVEALNYWIWNLSWVILSNILHNLSFAGQVGFIVHSSRSVAKFWPHMMSPPYFCIRRTFFHWGPLSFCLSSTEVHILQPISEPCSLDMMYPREWRIARHASLMRVDKHALTCEGRKWWDLLINHALSTFVCSYASAEKAFAQLPKHL